MSEQISKEDCYTLCNKKYKAINPQRIYCKKGCDSGEDTLQGCKDETCSKLCIKHELGEDDSKLGGWSTFFSRAPKDPSICLSACIYGCNCKNDEDDDDDDDDDKESDKKSDKGSDSDDSSDDDDDKKKKDK